MPPKIGRHGRFFTTASGGAGRCKDFADVFKETGADAALAASLFHFRELSVGEVKQYLKDEGIWVRL